MDPDPNGLYTKRKQQRIGIRATSSATDSSNGDANKPSVKYPSDQSINQSLIFNECAPNHIGAFHGGTLKKFKTRTIYKI